MFGRESGAMFRESKRRKPIGVNHATSGPLSYQALGMQSLPTISDAMASPQRPTNRRSESPMGATPPAAVTALLSLVSDAQSLNSWTKQEQDAIEGILIGWPRQYKPRKPGYSNFDLVLQPYCR